MKYYFSNQNGITHILLLILLMIGIVIGALLVQQTQIFSPKAQSVDNTEPNGGRLSEVRASLPHTEKFLMVNYKFTNPGETKIQTRVRLAVADLEAKSKLISAYYTAGSNMHLNGELMIYLPAKSPFDPQWSWTINPYSVKIAEVTNPSCLRSPFDIEAEVESQFNIDHSKETLVDRMPFIFEWCIQTSSIESIEGVSPLNKDPDVACAQVVTPACLNSDNRICLDFADACIPEGWTKQSRNEKQVYSNDYPGR